jgi:hypothetical protein
VADTRRAEGPRFRVRFDELPFAEDLDHASAAGRRVALEARRGLEREGFAVDELVRCLAEARDGTRLKGCVKTYLPQPDGPWGMVFTGDREPDATPVLVCVAFGLRHPDQPWQPSVYQVAQRRLHGGAR